MLAALHRWLSTLGFTAIVGGLACLHVASQQYLSTHSASQRLLFTLSFTTIVGGYACLHLALQQWLSTFGFTAVGVAMCLSTLGIVATVVYTFGIISGCLHAASRRWLVAMFVYMRIGSS